MHSKQEIITASRWYPCGDISHIPAVDASVGTICSMVRELLRNGVTQVNLSLSKDGSEHVFFDRREAKSELPAACTRLTSDFRKEMRSLIDAVACAGSSASDRRTVSGCRAEMLRHTIRPHSVPKGLEMNYQWHVDAGDHHVCVLGESGKSTGCTEVLHGCVPMPEYSCGDGLDPYVEQAITDSVATQFKMPRGTVFNLRHNKDVHRRSPHEDEDAVRILTWVYY